MTVRIDRAVRNPWRTKKRNGSKRSAHWHIEGRTLGQGEEAAEVNLYEHRREAMTKGAKVDAKNAKCLEPDQSEG